MKKTKKLVLSEELLSDEASNILAFIANWIGQSLATTHNVALLAEVAANGTSYKTFASASALAVGELEDVAFNDTVSNYLTNSGAAWIMRASTHGAIMSLTGDVRQYAEQTAGF